MSREPGRRDLSQSSLGTNNPGSVGGTSGDSPRSLDGDFLWISPAELALVPTEGPSWAALLSYAQESISPNIGDQDSSDDIRTLAAALVYARTGDEGMRRLAEQLPVPPKGKRLSVKGLMDAVYRSVGMDRPPYVSDDDGDFVA